MRLLSDNGLRNVLLTGCWPPTNEMVRRFSPDPVQNPEGWIGVNWEGRGYNVYSFFPEFPRGVGQGEGDFEVDYQDTSGDWWRIIPGVRPISIITFSRAGFDRNWTIEGGNRTYPENEWIGDFEPPLRPTPELPIMIEEPPYTERYSSQPMKAIRDAVREQVPGLNPVITPLDTSNYLYNFIGYHGNWYRYLHADRANEEWVITGGHVHVGFQMSLEEATAATYVTVRVVLDAPIASSASPTLMVTKPWILRTSPDSVFASAREAIEARALRFSSERSSALEDVVHRLSTGRGKHRCLPSLLLNPIAFAPENWHPGQVDVDVSIIVRRGVHPCLRSFEGVGTMRGKRLGAFACAGLFAVSALAQEIHTLVDFAGNVITLAEDQSIQSPPPWSLPKLDRPMRSSGIIAIPEFVGDRQEGFETQCPCDPPFYSCVPNGRMFQEIADLCAESAHITSGWGFRCTIQRRSGSSLYGSTGSASTITFDTGWEALRFGGYFGTNAGEGDDADIEFYDIDDNLIDLLVAHVPADCTWNWNGWESDIPINRIVITGNNPFGGGLIQLHDMEYSRAPQDPGACCLPDGSCTDDVRPGECAQNGGRFEGNTLCKDLDPPCTELLGGCCIEAGGGCEQSCERECDGDIDCDGQVNPVDLGLCLAAMGSDDPQDLCDYDMDCDGQINPVDCGLVQTLFDTCEEPREPCGGVGGDPVCAVIPFAR